MQKNVTAPQTSTSSAPSSTLTKETRVLFFTTQQRRHANTFNYSSNMYSSNRDSHSAYDMFHGIST